MCNICFPCFQVVYKYHTECCDLKFVSPQTLFLKFIHIDTHGSTSSYHSTALRSAALPGRARSAVGAPVPGLWPNSSTLRYVPKRNDCVGPQKDFFVDIQHLYS